MLGIIARGWTRILRRKCRLYSGASGWWFFSCQGFRRKLGCIFPSAFPGNGTKPRSLPRFRYDLFRYRVGWSFYQSGPSENEKTQRIEQSKFTIQCIVHRCDVFLRSTRRYRFGFLGFCEHERKGCSGTRVLDIRRPPLGIRVTIHSRRRRRGRWPTAGPGGGHAVEARVNTTSGHVLLCRGNPLPAHVISTSLFWRVGALIDLIFSHKV